MKRDGSWATSRVSSFYLSWEAAGKPTAASNEAEEKGCRTGRLSRVYDYMMVVGRVTGVRI